MPTPQNQHPQTLGERPPRRRTPSHYLNRAENDPLFEVSISRAGDASVRVALFEAAHLMLTRSKHWSKLKAWALARKIAVILHRMWIDGTKFRFVA